MNLFTEQNIIIMAIVIYTAIVIYAIGYLIKYLISRNNEKKRDIPWV